MTYKLKTVQDYLNLTLVKANHLLTYGKHSEQYFVLYLPETNKYHPVITLLHGGYWRAQFSLSQLEKISKAFTKIGYVVCILTKAFLLETFIFS